MLDSKDLKDIKGIVKEIVKEELSGSEKRLRGEIKGEIKASEARLRREIKASETRVIKDVGEFIQESVFPLIEEKADQKEVNRIKAHLGIVSD